MASGRRHVSDQKFQQLVVSVYFFENHRLKGHEIERQKTFPSKILVLKTLMRTAFER